MYKLLFIAAHRPDRSPSQRFRFEQYFSYLSEKGFSYYFSYLLSEQDDKLFYLPGKLHTKFYILIKSAINRLKDVLKSKNYDIVYIQREAFMTSSVFFEEKFKKSGAKLVFDFDDAIWNLDISDANKKFSWLKNPGKTAKIISLCDLVIAGNRYLADYAHNYNKNVVIIPTTIDTDVYKKNLRQGTRKDTICIGWSGSITTIKHFEYAIPFLKKLKEKFGEKLSVKVIGDSFYKNEELGVAGIAWNKENEVAELSTFDIGIMPLPDDEWAKGKCGLKGLQYMALEIPCIMSPVGVNTEIISDGENGYLANSTEEWVEKLSLLIENPELRNRIGKEARKTVVERYSVVSQRDRYLKVFNDLLKK